MHAMLPADPAGNLTISVSAFKARCLEIFKALETGELARVTVTRRGRPVAELTPLRAERRRAWGCMQGTVRTAPGLDLTEPVLDEPLDAELGILHR